MGCLDIKNSEKLYKKINKKEIKTPLSCLSRLHTLEAVHINETESEK